MEVVVLQLHVATLSVASCAHVYLGTVEMDLRVKVSRTEIQACLDIPEAI